MSRPAEDVLTQWRAEWPQALEIWSRFTKLREPVWCFTQSEERAEQLTGSFAMIRLTDQRIVISLRQATALGLEDYPREVMGHEIGHHVFCPGDLNDEARLMVRIRAALPSREQYAGLVSNLYSDLLINDRLTRIGELRMADIYEKLSGASSNRLWTFYMRICEILWSLERGRLARGVIDETLDTDAMLGARVIRTYGKEWMRGAGRFAALCFDYLDESGDEVTKQLGPWLDTHGRHEPGVPDGLAEVDEEELSGAIHPALDPEITGVDAPQETARPIPGGASEQGDGTPRKRYREPSEYLDVLKSLGVTLSEDAAVARYYRERALPHLLSFPKRELPRSSEPLQEGLETWDAGEALEEIDIAETTIRGTPVIPGFTTVKRVYGTTEGTLPAREPLDLYVGIDCSGSMGNPRFQNSWPILAGTILALSALRAGSRVKVVLSGEPGKYTATRDFGRDETEILTTLTSYLGTGYAFGIHRLAATFDARKASDRPVHILVVSDHDIFAMLAEPKDGQLGWDVARAAVQKARGGATYVLNMPEEYEREGVSRMRQDGWNVAFVTEWEDIVAFAREFSRRTFGEPGRSRMKE